jgi:hypothetical protein
MRLRGLLAALVVLLILGGAVYWSNKAKRAEEAKPAVEAAPTVVAIPADQIQNIEIRRPGAEPLLLSKDGSGHWSMLSAPRWPVDQDAAMAIVNTVSYLASERLVEEKATDLASFGLSTPSVEIGIGLKDGKMRKVLVGDDTPTGGGCFGMVQGETKVYVLASYAKTSLDKTPRDLRDKRLLTFSADSLARVELTAKGQTVEFGKNSQNEWQIIRPRPMRADGGKVEELVQRLSDARMDAFISEEDDKKSISAFAAAAKVAVVRVSDAGGTQQLEVRRDKDEHLYARSSVISEAHRTTAVLAEALDKRLDDFRNRKLLDFGWSDPMKVEFRDGQRQAVYQKSGEKWMAGAKQMDAASVNALVDKLRDLSAAGFPDSGYTAPVIEASVTSNDGKRVERVLISRQGDKCFAKRDGEPAIYELDLKTVEDLQKVFAGVKEAPASAPAKKK